MMKGELLTVAEVAKKLHLRRETIRRYIKEGHLKALILPGGDYRVEEKRVRALLHSTSEQR